MAAKLVGGQLPVALGERQYVVYTTLVAKEDLARDASLSACPVIYQRYVEKAFELRVTVVGDEVFAARIYSQESDGGTIDWRHALSASIRYEVHELDPDLADQCRRLARRLRLEFAGIDLIVTPDEETVFLEVNAAGQWAWWSRPPVCRSRRRSRSVSSRARANAARGAPRSGEPRAAAAAARSLPGGGARARRAGGHRRAAECWDRPGVGVGRLDVARTPPNRP